MCLTSILQLRKAREHGLQEERGEAAWVCRRAGGVEGRGRRRETTRAEVPAARVTACVLTGARPPSPLHVGEALLRAVRISVSSSVGPAQSAVST